MKKNIGFYCFLTSFDFLSLKNDVNVLVPSRRKKHKNLVKNSKNRFFVGVLKVTDEKRRIWSRTKMSWIRNTAV
jgi:hypothetical protein